jgi:hypothetical protein
MGVSSLRREKMTGFVKENGDFSGGVPKKSFQGKPDGQDCARACAPVGEAGDRAVLENVTPVTSAGFDQEADDPRLACNQRYAGK